jgi:hypothetical protein
MTAVNNRANRRTRATKLSQKVLKVGLIGGVILGSVLGIPAFTRGAEALVGENITEMLNGWLQFSFATGMTKFCIIGALIIGGSGVWKSNLDMLKKFVGLGLVGLLAFYIFSMSAESVAGFLLGSLTPIVGCAVWGLVNALEIKLLTLWDDDAALKKIFSKTRSKSKLTGDETVNDDFTPAQTALMRRLGRDRVGESIAFFTAAGVVAYVIEILVNIIYGNGFTTINWMTLLRPGELASIAMSLVWGFIVLVFSTVSIETCIVALQRSDDLKEAIEE